MTIPETYAELLARKDAPGGSTWGLFGPDDQRGAANFAQAPQVLRGVECVTTGTVLSLDYALDTFDPPLFASRRSLQHEITAMHRNQRDDVVREFYPQASSQLDGLRHRRAQDAGFYNGFPDAGIIAGTPDLGIQAWAENPIVGRGVLVDLSAALARRGHQIAFRAGEPIGLEIAETAIADQCVQLAAGDLILLHTGWAAWYLNQPADIRRQVREAGRYPGMAQSTAFPGWLYDNRVALLAADTPALEVVPPSPDSPYRVSASDDGGMMHQELIAKLGMPLGELWKLDVLASACEARQSWEFLLTVKPICLTGGVGSPANAIAIW